MSKQIEISVRGMDCAGCVRAVDKALSGVPGVVHADVYLAGEKAVLTVDEQHFRLEDARKTITAAGYKVPEPSGSEDVQTGQRQSMNSVAGRAFRLFGLIFGMVLLVVAGGEWFGLFESMTATVPYPAGAVFVLLIGWPVLKKVVTAAFQKTVTPHALMAVGAVAALLIGEWVTAAIVVFFMRTGDFVEGYTTDKARYAIRSLIRQAPQKANVVRDGVETELPVDQIRPGDLVLVRPGGKIPVDGIVREGGAAVDQSAITGESMTVDAGPGSSVFAATSISGGHLLISATAVGAETTFGKIIKLVEEAEKKKGNVQSFADSFSGYYLPVVMAIALVTWLAGQPVMAVVAVLVVACSCAFALATPVAMLASIGSAAKNGIMIKGGKYLEEISRADVLLVDKTGTLTTGTPVVSDIIPLNGISSGELLQIAASSERYSEHPLAGAILKAAADRFLLLSDPGSFRSIPGEGVEAVVKGDVIRIKKAVGYSLDSAVFARIDKLTSEGKTVMTVDRNGVIVGIIAATDEEREHIHFALQQVRQSGITRIELLTGDNRQTAGRLAKELGIDFRSDLMPEDKISIVREYQAAGHTVVMIGDGVNDAPALAQANVGISINKAGTAVAVDTAHINLMRDDWRLVPELFFIANRSMRVVRGNFAFTAVYNIIGLSLAATGFLPPVVAAAAQSIPDVGIMLNSSRLLGYRSK